MLDSRRILTDTHFTDGASAPPLRTAQLERKKPAAMIISNNVPALVATFIAIGGVARATDMGCVVGVPYNLPAATFADTVRWISDMGASDIGSRGNECANFYIPAEYIQPLAA